MCVDIKCDFGLRWPPGFCDGGETDCAESRTRRLAIWIQCISGSLFFSSPACLPPSVQVKVGSGRLERCASASSFRSCPMQFVLNAGGDNYPALARPVLGLWPAATRDASERGMRPLNTTKARTESNNKKKKESKTLAVVFPRSCESTLEYQSITVSHYCFFHENLREKSQLP